MDKAKWNRLAVICRLVERAGDFNVGRTALMKFLYILKEVKGVPLDYRFTLYTYGPFDSRVLDDLSYAESLEAVDSAVVPYPGGTGYIFKPGAKAEKIASRGEDFLALHLEDIEWVVNEFGQRTAADLEMISTVIYVDRQAKKCQKSLTLEELATKVVDIKPHLEKATVLREAEELCESAYLEAVAA